MALTRIIRAAAFASLQPVDSQISNPCRELKFYTPNVWHKTKFMLFPRNKKSSWHHENWGRIKQWQDDFLILQFRKHCNCRTRRKLMKTNLCTQCTDCLTYSHGNKAGLPGVLLSWLCCEFQASRSYSAEEQIWHLRRDKCLQIYGTVWLIYHLLCVSCLLKCGMSMYKYLNCNEMNVFFKQKRTGNGSAKGMGEKILSVIAQQNQTQLTATLYFTHHWIGQTNSFLSQSTTDRA